MQIDPEARKLSEIMTREELEKSEFISQHPVIAESDDIEMLKKLQKDLIEKVGYKKFNEGPLKP